MAIQPGRKKGSAYMGRSGQIERCRMMVEAKFAARPRHRKHIDHSFVGDGSTIKLAA
ncbi:MAG: hypothetical protein KAI50_05580 [Desulfobacterales bacterium]|nr:hypothetical protein [Desulfobacterales bacterium]